MTDVAPKDSVSNGSVEAAPQLRVISGNPTETELAAVTAVLTALGAEDDGGQRPAAPAVRSAWSVSQRQLRREIVPGPGAWNRQNL